MKKDLTLKELSKAIADMIQEKPELADCSAVDWFLDNFSDNFATGGIISPQDLDLLINS